METPIAPASSFQPLRLRPGTDLRAALDQALRDSGHSAGFVVAGFGSLQRATLRLAGAESQATLEGELELLSLTGTLSPDGSHLHASVATTEGRVFGGHVTPGCFVRTTAELLIAWLPDWRFAREFDPSTGYAELQIQPR